MYDKITFKPQIDFINKGIVQMHFLRLILLVGLVSFLFVCPVNSQAPSLPLPLCTLLCTLLEVLQMPCSTLSNVCSGPSTPVDCPSTEIEEACTDRYESCPNGNITKALQGCFAANCICKGELAVLGLPGPPSLVPDLLDTVLFLINNVVNTLLNNKGLDCPTPADATTCEDKYNVCPTKYQEAAKKACMMADCACSGTTVPTAPGDVNIVTGLISAILTLLGGSPLPLPGGFPGIPGFPLPGVRYG